VEPDCLVDTNALHIFWNTDGSTNFTAIPLARVGTTLYRGSIPPQPEGTTVSYWIEAVPVLGQPLRHPSDAPATLHRFQVAPALGLAVSANPEQVASVTSVTPDYGPYKYPSGVVIHASADALTEPVNDSRWACAGWTGSGSVPESGDSNAVTWVLSLESSLQWNWRTEYAFIQSANIGGLLATTTWWAAGSTGMTHSAPGAVTLNGTNYAFVCWMLNGVRQPDNDHTAVNPVTGIPITAPRHADAVYMDSQLDADNDGLQDWWELTHFGSTNAVPGVDDDGDGFINLDEFLDHTDPRDVNSVPSPPVILHTPLTSPQGRPAPFVVQATITDNFTVASATLRWSRSGAPFSQTNFAAAVSNVYTAFIPEPGIQGDTFTYLLLAADARGGVATNGPHTFRVDYPLLDLAPDEIETVLRPATISNVALSVSNPGSTNLVLDAYLLSLGFADRGEQGAGSWTHSGAGDLWTLSTNRFFSNSHAWYCGNASSRVYGPSMHARLDSPPIVLGRGAQLTFWHWIKCELDTQQTRTGWKPGYAWDGAMVELSTNSGLTFTQLTPTGGYSHKISGWSKSPWVQDTACFAGTGGWQRATFALDAYALKTAVLRFHFGTDDNTQEEGWYLDDVVVTPESGSNLWLTLAPAHLDLPAGGQTNLTVTFNSSGIPTGDRQTAIQVDGNAVNRPTSVIPVLMQVRSPAVLSGLQALQTSLHGEGFVTVSNRIHDVDGDTCALDLAWSTTGGASWSNLAILAAWDASGLSILAATNSPQVENIRTSENALCFTNSLTAIWNTSDSGSGIELSPDVIVRGRLWDGVYWSDWTTSQPFIVDNKPPDPPGGLWATTHDTASWSTNSHLSIQWQTAGDGSGVGLADYDYGMGTTATGGIASGSTTNLESSLQAPSDGSNWFVFVRARDLRGNVSAATVEGPYWVDSSPPSATNAVVTLSHSPFGNYLIGPTPVTGSWTGFSDTASGIRNYYYAFSNQAGSTNGFPTASTAGTLSNALIGVTNTLFVWAEDHAGLIGSAAAASCLVLDAAGDQDGDQLSNADEEFTGTDANDPASALRLSNTQDGPAHDLILRWPAITNRLYTLHYRDSLLSDTNWSSVPDFTDVPGLNGTMTYTDRTVVLPSRFYQITVRPP
jgi:hypothetical protein